MTDLVTEGSSRIAAAVARSEQPSILIEMARMLGDVLHSTVVVRHYRAVYPNHHIVWAIGEQYVDTFTTFTPSAGGPHSVAALPALPPFPQDGPIRVAWVRNAAKLPNVEKAFGCGVHPWGWPQGTIVDAIHINASISSLVVERRPYLPLAPEDYRAAEAFILQHNLVGGYVTMEYDSASVAPLPIGYYHALADRIEAPVVSLARQDAPRVPGTFDGRGTPIRVAKALIAHSKCFVGRGSGLSLVAATAGCAQPIVDLIDSPLALATIGYRARDASYHNPAGQPINVVAALINAFVKGETGGTGTPRSRHDLRRQP